MCWRGRTKLSDEPRIEDETAGGEEEYARKILCRTGNFLSRRGFFRARAEGCKHSAARDSAGGGTSGLHFAILSPGDAGSRLRRGKEYSRRNTIRRGQPKTVG